MTPSVCFLFLYRAWLELVLSFFLTKRQGHCFSLRVGEINSYKSKIREGGNEFRDTTEIHQSGSRGRSTRAIARLRPASTQSFASTWIFRNSCVGWQEIFLNVLSFLSFQRFPQTRAKIDLQDFALSFPMEAFVRCHQLTRESSWTAAIAGVMFSLQSVRCQTSFAKSKK